MTDAEERPGAAAHEDTGAENRKALARLGLIVLAALVASVVAGVERTVAVVLAVVAMIMLHELGHFVTAKWAGMKVTEYFLGFGPRLWSIRRGETEYGVKAVPAGGYVRIVGMHNLEEVDAGDEPRTYRESSFPRRLLVVSAGSIVHFLLAFGLLWSVWAFVGITPLDAEPTTEVQSLVALEGRDSPAMEAGIRPGDVIVAIDGQTIDEWEQVRDLVRERPGQPVEIVVERDGARRSFTLTPVDLSEVEVEGGPAVDEPVGFVGISPAFPTEQVGPVAAVGRAGGDLLEVSGATLEALGRLVTLEGIGSYVSQFTGEADTTPDEDDVRFISPVGLVQVAGAAAETGLSQVLMLLALINVFVGIINMVPLPPLDGGHAAIAVYERLRSRRGRRHHVDMNKVMPVAYAVFLVLVLIGVTSLWLDITRPLDL